MAQKISSISLVNNIVKSQEELQLLIDKTLLQSLEATISDFQTKRMSKAVSILQK